MGVVLQLGRDRVSNDDDTAWDASRLRQMIADRGMLQRRLAELCNVSQGTITSWTRGRTEPGVTDLGNLAVALRCKVLQIMPPRQR